LAREKANDWTDPKYHFSDCKVSICTGDYKLTPERSKELEDSDIIIMTSEMLNSRCRNFDSEKNNWIKDIGTIIIDESHLLTVAGRGDHLEVGLMKFTEINPNARLILLSATMPNVEEIANWVSYSLTKKDTFCLRSTYRPVPLTVHYELYDDESSSNYQSKELEKVDKAIDIIRSYEDDKFLVFAHTKRTGELMKNSLKSFGIEAQFHNADLESDKRAELEERFKTDPKLRVIIATSTLAWGLNLPARRVVILGVHRGLDEVESYDVIQMIGRSGRYGIDPKGDAYILIPSSKADYFKNKLNKPSNIESQLLTQQGSCYHNLAFHLVSEINNGTVQTNDDINYWFGRSLASFQSMQFDDKIIERTISMLQKCGAIDIKDDCWFCKPIGKVASMFYFNPFDVSNLYFNFRELFSEKLEEDDYRLSMALAYVNSIMNLPISRLEKEECSLFANKVRNYSFATIKCTDAVLRNAYCYHSLLNGINTQACSATQRSLQFDFQRVSQALQFLDSLGGNWKKKSYFKVLEKRILYGVPGHLISLCEIKDIGKVRANKFYDNGIKTIQDVADLSVERIKSILNVKPEMAKNIKDEAQKQLLVL
jgi:helicase